MSGYEQYDLQDEDPYLIPGSTCLTNLLGATDTATLNMLEAELSSIALSELFVDPVPPTFDLAHLQEIHRRLFSDVYVWAGSLRLTEIGKGDQLFLPYRNIPSKADIVFAELRSECFLRNLALAEFVDRAAYYLGTINMMHAFREGNGRTQRVLIDQLAEQAGYVFTWSAISGEQMATACRKARINEPDYTELKRLLGLNIEHRE